jgi:hypothetical protein
MKSRVSHPTTPDQVWRHCRDVLFPVLIAARKQVDAIKAAKAATTKERNHVVMS